MRAIELILISALTERAYLTIGSLLFLNAATRNTLSP